MIFQDPTLIAPTPISADPATASQVLPAPTIEWTGLAPVIILGVGALVLLTIVSLMRGRTFKGFYALYTVGISVAAAIAVLPTWARVQGWSSIFWIDLTNPNGTGPYSTIAGAVGIDGFTCFMTLVILSAVFISALLASSYLRREEMDGPEFYVLVMLSAFGGILMAMANDLIVLFIGLETLSLAVYILTAMNLRRVESQEGGFKYFILGGFSSAFFLYGIALLYGATGTTSLIGIKNFLAANFLTSNALLLIGLAMLLVGFAFKIGAVPFHSWSPDAYDGGPTPSVAYMAAAVKAAAFAGLVRVFMVAFETYKADWQPLIYALSILSLVLGALFAIVQTNVKRMMAYSSISHAGFILMAVQSGTALGISAVLFYSAAYVFMVAGSFGIISVVSRKGDANNSIDDYRGLAKTNPLLALVFSVLLLAQAGVPFTSGFFAKFYAIDAAVDAHSWPLAIIAMVSAVAAAFLYLRLIIAMYMSGDDHGEIVSGTGVEKAGDIKVPFSAGLAIAICFVVTIVMGVLPDTVLDPATKATPVLVNLPDPAAASPTLEELMAGLGQAPADTGAEASAEASADSGS